jgi:uncharacterized protein
MHVMARKIEILESIQSLDAAAWNRLTDGSPALSHTFLRALEQSGCVGPGTGWQSLPMVVFDDQQLVGAVPMYAKSHSYGEYVFDWAWANAFERHGLAYYPKLLVAIPFTPIPGPRLLSHDPEIQRLMAEVLAGQLERSQLSSAHILFPDARTSDILAAAGWIKRQGVQFRWENAAYRNFDEFLQTLKHDKRKKIRQERARVHQAGIVCRCLMGDEITEADWHLFFQCYINTYEQHRSSPYLNLDFFLEIGRNMPKQIMLVLAELEGRPMAAALNLLGTLHDGTRCLYGRYWGALAYVPGLHYELCYYQAQEYCIVHGIQYFEGGAQGEHKLARGFKPRSTCSYHLVHPPAFSEAIEQAVNLEAGGVMEYQTELEARAPFKHPNSQD